MKSLNHKQYVDFTYYAFGMEMPGRSYANSSEYRYGFNGKENDNEVKGTGIQQDYGIRIYDTRIGKFLSTDPISKRYPFYSPYLFAGNKPIRYVDLDGLEEASKQQKAAALTMVTSFESNASSKQAFANINKSDLIVDLRNIISNPGSMKQGANGGEWYCALYAISYNMVYHHPEVYTAMVLGLYQNGNFGGQDAGKKLKEADGEGNSKSAFIFGNVIRTMYNSVYSDYSTDKGSRSTSSETMKEWLNMLNINTSEFSYGYELIADGISMEDMPSLKEHIDAGMNAVLLVSYDQLTSGSGSESKKTSVAPYGDHFITLTGNFKYSEKENSVIFDYYDQHGQGLKTTTMTLETFQAMTNRVFLLKSDSQQTKSNKEKK